MAQTQNSNAPTNSDVQQVSFSDVSLTHLTTYFKDTYKVSKGSASQVVLGFRSMTERLTNPQNEYQQTLYPKLKQLCTDVFSRYETDFLTNFGSDVERQVFGANLNGNRNNGSLFRSIPSGVNRTLTYNYAQFGQLMRVLTSRLKFVVQRDPNSVQRYKDNQDEFAAYQKLQTTTNSFLEFLTTVSNDWNTFVSETRTKYAVSTEQSGQTQQNQTQQNRQQRPQRPQREQTSQQRPRQTRNQTEQSENSTTTRQPRQTTGTSQRRQNYRPVRSGTSQTGSTGSQEGVWQSARSNGSRRRTTSGRSQPVVL